MRPDYCVAFGPSLDCVEFDLKTIIPYFLCFLWRNKQHLLEIHACSIWHWTRVLKTNVHIWGSSCFQEQQRKSGQIRHELWTLINDKPPHPAEETQPPFSLFSPAALLSKSFSCFLSYSFFSPCCFFVLMFIDPWPQHKYCGRAMKTRENAGQRQEGITDGMNLESLGLHHRSSACNFIHGQTRRRPAQSGSQHLHLSPASDGLLSGHADCNHQDRSDCLFKATIYFKLFLNIQTPLAAGGGV